MNDLNQFEERIQKYISRELSAAEQAEFEQDIANNEALQREVRERSIIQVSMMISDNLDASHLSEGDLTAFIQSKASMNSGDLERVTQHIRECEVCLNFTEDAAAVWALANEIPPESAIDPDSVRLRGAQETSPFIKFLKKLFVIPVPIRPAYGLILLVLIAMPLIRAMLTDDSTGRMASYELVESQLRGSSSINKIEITSDLEIIHFDFVLPVRQDRSYDILLLDSLRNIIHAQYNVPSADIFTLEVLVANVYVGLFEVSVIERDDAGAQTEEFILPVQITQPE